MKNIIKIENRAIKEGAFEFGNIPSTITCNSQYFSKNGMPYTPISGEIHYNRIHPDKWETELLKMRANGVDVVASYVFWNQHEMKPNEFNFQGCRDIHRFVTTCHKLGMPLILRAGPWAHGEAVYGGFPKWVNKMPTKRTNAPKYLAEVKKFWTAVYGEIKEFLDGETIIAMQLENEYTGNLTHILKLREIAEEIGYKVPFFTMTLWPTNTPTPKILALLGGYPEAPWHFNKQPLRASGKFAISPHKTEVEIGEDLIKVKKELKGSFEDYPYAGCEIGAGNQVTAHRRPKFGELDGYAVCFTKYASGLNLLGYYMYHGGYNPNDGLWQESRKTLYPNNYPIIDYDFQAPIGRRGDLRPQGKRLRMLHTFLTSYDSDACTAQPFFPSQPAKSYLLPNIPQYSVRVKPNGEGYCFVSTYERTFAYDDNIILDVSVNTDSKSYDLPTLTLPRNSMFFYPFNTTLYGKHFDYITAQPLARTETDNIINIYYSKINGIDAIIKSGDDIIKLSEDKAFSYTQGGQTINIILISHTKAMDFYTYNNQIIYSDKTIYFTGDKVCYNDTVGGYINIDGKEITVPYEDRKPLINLTESKKVLLPHNYYLYSNGKRHYYALTIDDKLINDYIDAEITLDFVGLNLQVFSGKQIVDDYFNTDGKYVMRISDIKDYLKISNRLTIVAVPATSWGVSKVYNEINIPEKIVDLRIASVVPIINKAIELKTK